MRIVIKIHVVLWSFEENSKSKPTSQRYNTTGFVIISQTYVDKFIDVIYKKEYFSITKCGNNNIMNAVKTFKLQKLSMKINLL